jgi:hypothetical protein
MRRSARNFVVVCGAMALLFALAATLAAGSASAAFGVNKWEAGTCNAGVGECTYASPFERFDSTAAGHPAEGLTDFAFNTGGLLGAPEGAVKDVRVDLPQGLNVNPQAVQWCPRATFEANPATCPASSQVGTSTIKSISSVLTVPLTLPVYDIEPEVGHPALFGFNINIPLILPDHDVYLVTGIDWAGDYHESFTISEVPTQVPLVENKLVFNGQAGGSFLTLPSPCNGPTTTTLRVDSYEEPGAFHEYKTTPALPNQNVPIVGCATVPFHPTVTAAASGPTDSSAPVSVSLNVPQGSQPQNSSTVKTANVTLPAGTGLNPATAPGLKFCPDGSFPLKSEAAITCPAESQVGIVAIEAPELPAGSLKGPVYLAEQKSREPASGNEYRIFFNAESSRYGVQVREEGKVKANPTTGQLTAEFNELPQVGFSSATLTFGPQAKHAIPVLSTPPLCTNTATSSAVPYSTGANTATPTTELKLTSAPGGAPCAKSLAERPFKPTVTAKPLSSKALAYTPFQLQITRNEGQQEIKGFNLTLPPGATAKLAGVSYCETKEFEAATKLSGIEEQKKWSCTGKSEIGVATIMAGTGSTPLKIEGKVFLGGPYKGAPLSVVVITPAVAGPFDLGNVVVHAPLNVDPESGQVQTSAEIPDVFGGAKLDIRSISVNLNRKEFTLNGTNCNKNATTGSISGGGADPTNPGAWSSAAVSVPFQGEGCEGLAFKPSLHARLFGATRRAKNPKLKATLTTKAGQANVSLASLALPHAIFLDQASLASVCTRPQFAAGQCPAKSRYGFARAFTPLLDKPLEGPVYLRSSNNTLPDMVADLKGQVSVVLDGRIDSFKGGIRTTFAGIPDLPVSKFVLTLPGGKHGLLQASTNLCAKPVKGIVRLIGQNGAKANRHERIQTPCKGKHPKKHKKSKKGKHAKHSKKHKSGGHKQKAKQ